MRYFVSSENAATPANTHHAWVLQWSSTGVPGTRRISATPLPVSIALAGHTNARRCAERDRHLDDRAREDRGEDLRHADLEAAASTCPRTWIVMMTAATCRRGSLELRQHHGVGAAARARASRVVTPQ